MAEAQRQCGDCSLCCKVLKIAELNKPKDVWCQNFLAGTGCGIYADRPPSCRNFVCRWLADPSLGPEWKPNVCKMVLSVTPSLLVVHVDPSAVQPWRAEPYFSTLKRLAAQGVASGTVVVAMERHRAIAIHADRVEDLGAMGPGTRISVSLVMTAGGPRLQPRILGPHEQSKTK